MSQFMLPILLILVSGILSIIYLPKLGISPIVGFILAGAFLGEHGFHLIPHSDVLHVLAELGVVFLLFDIGLHFSIKHVWKEKKGIFIAGPLQVISTAILFYFVLMLFGLSSIDTVIIALGLALSSTAVASQVIADNKLNGTPNANLSISILVFQDIIAIFLLVIAGVTSNPELDLTNEILIALLKCLASVVIAFVFGKYVLNPFLQNIIKHKNSDAFTIIALFIVLATGFTTYQVGLSLTLGAFLAGMLISESPFKTIIQTETRPFRFLLLSFFFITVGMNIDFHFIKDNIMLILLATAGLILVKTIVTTIVLKLLKESSQTSLQVATLIAQGSEFLFVIFAIPGTLLSMSDGFKSIFIVSVVISMGLTSVSFLVMNKLARKLKLEQGSSEDADLKEALKSPSVVIIGMNDIGQTIARACEHFSIPYVSVDNDYIKFVDARSKGFPVVYGDKNDMRFWDSFGVNRFKYLVVTAPSPELSQAYADIAEHRYPNIERFAAISDINQMPIFKDLYDKTVLCKSTPAGLEVAEVIIDQVIESKEEIELWIREENQSN